MDMQDSAKKRRSKVLEKSGDKSRKTEVVEVEDDAESKKSSGKGKQNIWTSEPLPAGHWENRPRKDEQKEALRKKLEEHKKEKLEEYQRQKLRDTFKEHFGGKGTGGGTITTESGGSKEKKADPGPDEAGSDPSSSEETESSDGSDDPVQTNPDGSRDLE